MIKLLEGIHDILQEKKVLATRRWTRPIGELDTPDNGGDSGRAVKSIRQNKKINLKALTI